MQEAEIIHGREISGVLQSWLNKSGVCHFLIKYCGLESKASAYNAGDPGSIPESGDSPGDENGTLLQYSCPENPMDGGAWEAAVHGILKSWTRLSDFTFTFTYI